MARKSIAALSIVPISLAPKVKPPPELTRKQRELWQAIVEAKPGEWFGADSAPLLTEYVRACVMAGALEDQIQAAMAGGPVSEVASLLALRDREVRRASSLATRLRLTQQARYTPERAATASRKAGKPRPWQEPGRGAKAG